MGFVLNRKLGQFSPPAFFALGANVFNLPNYSKAQQFARYSSLKTSKLALSNLPHSLRAQQMP
jgi:hypothetical protein